MTTQQIGLHIKVIRRNKDLSTADLAALAGVSRQTIQAVERGRDLRMGTLRRIADALGVKLTISIEHGNNE